MSSPLYDAIIIGAGAAGLAAAAELARHRASALVLEARLHIGGRIWTHHEPGLAVPLELGAEFIHGRAAATFALLAKAATAAVDAAEEHWTLRSGKLELANDLFVQVRSAMRRSRALKGRDMSFARFLECLGPGLSDDARRYARTLAEGFDAADTRHASARAIVSEWTEGSSVDEPQFRPLGGYGPLASRLAAELRGSDVSLQLNTTVETVRWKRRLVKVEGIFLGRAYQAAAQCAIVTLPLGVLQTRLRDSGAVRFVPALAEKRGALKRLAAGPVIKVLLRFRSAFWERLDRGRYARAAFLHAPGAVFPTFWTTLPLRSPLLVAWAAGPNAERLAGANSDRLVGEALASLGSIFGEAKGAERALEGAWVHDWQADPYARGAYSYVTTGGEGAREALAAPLSDTLFFAGEAADTAGDAGTVAGALQSGVRAAREVLALHGSRGASGQSRKTAYSSSSRRGG